MYREPGGRGNDPEGIKNHLVSMGICGQMLEKGCHRASQHLFLLIGTGDLYEGKSR